MGVRFGMPAAPSRDTEVFAGLTFAKEPRRESWFLVFLSEVTGGSG